MPVISDLKQKSNLACHTREVDQEDFEHRNKYPSKRLEHSKKCLDGRFLFVRTLVKKISTSKKFGGT